MAARVYQRAGTAAAKAQRWETRCTLGRAEPEGRKLERLGRASNASPRSKKPLRLAPGGQTRGLLEKWAAHLEEKHRYYKPRPGHHLAESHFVHQLGSIKPAQEAWTGPDPLLMNVLTWTCALEETYLCLLPMLSSDQSLEVKEDAGLVVKTLDIFFFSSGYLLWFLIDPICVQCYFAVIVIVIFGRECVKHTNF